MHWCFLPKTEFLFFNFTVSIVVFLWLLYSKNIWRRRQWHPTPVLLPGKSHGQRSLVGCGPWGCEEPDMTEGLPFHFSLSCIGEGNGNPLQCSCLENPRDGGAWWAAIYGVAQSLIRLKWLSSSSISIESVILPNHLILCCPLLFSPSIFPSIRVFSNESALCIRWPKFQLQHQSFWWTSTTDFSPVNLSFITGSVSAKNLEGYREN